MAEGIDYRPVGTVVVTFDGTAYTLKRPKLKQYSYFRDQIRELSVTAVDKLTALRDETEAAEEDSDEKARLELELTHKTSSTYELTSVPWLKEVFGQLGDKPLPEDHEEWPAWLAADMTIPQQIRTHWATVPLAPGAKGTN